MIDFSKLIHDPDKIRSVLKKLPDKRLVTTAPLSLYFPERYVERDFAAVGSDIYCIGFIGIVLEGKYRAMLSVIAMAKFEPSSILKVEINGAIYYHLMFERGDTVMHSTELVKQDILSYDTYNEFIAAGKVPEYMGYQEMSYLFDTAGKHAGANVGERTEITETLVSLVARDPADRRKYYRVGLNKPDDLKKPPVILPLKSVEQATDTLTKLAGSYWERALVSAIINPSEKPERIETLLRS